MPEITIERFTQILLYKVDSGIDHFTGKKTGNSYHITFNPKKLKWYLEVNGSRRYVRVSLKSIANTIWDMELNSKVKIGGDWYGDEQSKYYTRYEK
jgi:hypothetical protein